jgi:enoyl-CoA hydratase/carnithine racemase
MKVARKIASKSKPTAMMVKECVNESYETSLQQGLKYERRLFHSTFATKD